MQGRPHFCSINGYPVILLPPSDWPEPTSQKVRHEPCEILPTRSAGLPFGARRRSRKGVPQLYPRSSLWQVARYLGITSTFQFTVGSGLSEMSTAVAITPASHRGMPRSASVGKFLPGTEYRIVSADGKPAKPGEAGELWVSGPSRAIGYLDNKPA